MKSQKPTNGATEVVPNENRKLNDHPVIVILGLLASVIAIFVFLTGRENISQVLNDDQSPAPTSPPNIISSTRPDHYGMFLKQENSFVELPFNQQSLPSTADIPKVPVTSNPQPTIVVWSPSIDMKYVAFVNTRNDEGRLGIYEQLEITITSRDDGTVEAQPPSALPSGLYCFVREAPHWEQKRTKVSKAGVLGLASRSLEEGFRKYAWRRRLPMN